MLELTAIYDRSRDPDAVCYWCQRPAAYVQRLDDGDWPLCMQCIPEWLRDRCAKDRGGLE